MASVGKSDMNHIDDSVTSVMDVMLKRFFISEKKLTDPTDNEHLMSQARALGYLASVKTSMIKMVRLKIMRSTLQLL